MAVRWPRIGRGWPWGDPEGLRGGPKLAGWRRTPRWGQGPSRLSRRPRALGQCSWLCLFPRSRRRAAGAQAPPRRGLGAPVGAQVAAGASTPPFLCRPPREGAASRRFFFFFAVQFLTSCVPVSGVATQLSDAHRIGSYGMKGLIGCQEPERRRRPPVFLEKPAPPLTLRLGRSGIRFSAAPSCCAS